MYYYCNRCGGKVYDITKPCPTCGMYLDNNVVNQNVMPSQNGKRIDKRIIFFCLGLIAVIAFFIFNALDIPSTEEFLGNGYRVKYLTDVWGDDVKSYGEYFVLFHKKSRDYLVFPNEVINYSLNLEDVDSRQSLYNSYQREFNNSSQISYNNIMSELKKLDGTSYYYLSADFYNYFDANYRGRVYFLHSADGKCLTLILVTGKNSAVAVEKDVLNLFKNIEL